MTHYYKTNIKALPVKLVWSWGNPFSFWAFLIRKALPFPAYGTTLVPGELSVVEIAEEAADADLAAAMSPHRRQLEELGYRTVLLYKVPTLGPTRGLGRALLSSDRRAVCLLISGRTWHISQVTTAIISISGNGQMVGTSSAVLRLPSVPGIEISRVPGAPAQVVAQKHMRRLESFQAEPQDASGVVSLIRQQQKRALAYYVATGVWVPATEQDVQRASRG